MKTVLRMQRIVTGCESSFCPGKGVHFSSKPVGGIEVQLKKAPAGPPAGEAVPAAAARASLSRYSLMLAPGVLGSLVAYLIYPLLDEGLAVTVSLCLLFLPLVLQLRSSLRKRLGQDLRGLRRAYLYSGVALVVLASVLLGNGWLDRAPPNIVRAALIQKTATSRGGGTRYVVTVTSWRAGRATEDFVVSSNQFKRFAVGSTVNVAVHQGFFGLPWSGRIFTE